jgi:hypothetical protein
MLAEFFKKNVVLCVIGIVCGVLVSRFAPLQAHLTLAVVLGAVIGISFSAIESTARWFAHRMRSPK